MNKVSEYKWHAKEKVKAAVKVDANNSKWRWFNVSQT